MRPEKPKRIDVNPIQAGLSGLGEALSGLNLGALPPPPPAVSADAPQPLKKKKLGRVVLRKECAHRGGKTVIVVDQFPSHVQVSELEQLARELRKFVGSGGSLKGRAIEIQGEQPAKIRAYLESLGYEVGGI